MIRKFLASLFLSLSAVSITFAQDMVITGVVDGPLSGGTPKAVELCVLNDIPDLSIYGVGSANNGGGSDGEEFTFDIRTLNNTLRGKMVGLKLFGRSRI